MPPSAKRPICFHKADGAERYRQVVPNTIAALVKLVHTSVWRTEEPGSIPGGGAINAHVALWEGTCLSSKIRRVRSPSCAPVSVSHVRDLSVKSCRGSKCHVLYDVDIGSKRWANNAPMVKSDITKLYESLVPVSNTGRRAKVWCGDKHRALARLITLRGNSKLVRFQPFRNQFHLFKCSLRSIKSIFKD